MEAVKARERRDRLSPAAGLLWARPVALLYSNCGILTFMSERVGLVSGRRDWKREEEIGRAAKNSNPIMKDRMYFYQIQVCVLFWFFFILLCCTYTSFCQISCVHCLNRSANWKKLSRIKNGPHFRMLYSLETTRLTSIFLLHANILEIRPMSPVCTG